MASLKGDRFQHVLERSKDMSERSKAMLERSKARQDAIEQRSKVLLERRSISRQDTKGRSKARLDVKHQQHVKKTYTRNLEQPRHHTSQYLICILPFKWRSLRSLLEPIASMEAK
jgi:hypothetical protein